MVLKDESESKVVYKTWQGAMTGRRRDCEAVGRATGTEIKDLGKAGLGLERILDCIYIFNAREGKRVVKTIF